VSLILTGSDLALLAAGARSLLEALARYQSIER
jgi:hypothetical protein